MDHITITDMNSIPQPNSDNGQMNEKISAKQDHNSATNRNGLVESEKPKYIPPPLRGNFDRGKIKLLNLARYELNNASGVTLISGKELQVLREEKEN